MAINEAGIQMYTSPAWLEAFKTGRVGWGVSMHAPRDYPYMRVPIVVPASEVLNAEEKQIRHNGEDVVFWSYDIRRPKEEEEESACKNKKH